MAVIKKTIYESSISQLLKSLSSVDGTEALIQRMLEYRRGLKNADKLNEDQKLELTNAIAFLAEERTKVVDWLGAEAWNAIIANSTGNAIAIAKASVRALNGDSAALRNAFVLDNALSLLGIDAGVPKHISANGVVQLGSKKSTGNSSSANGDRPSLRSVPAGSNFWYKYSGVWYQIIGTSTGVRLFNLATRVEVTDKNDLPENASAAQKKIMTWADAFRGYVNTCPEDVTALTEDEIMAEQA